MLILLANCNWQVICRIVKANHFMVGKTNLMYLFVTLTHKNFLLRRLISQLKSSL